MQIWRFDVVLTRWPPTAVKIRNDRVKIPTLLQIVRTWKRHIFVCFSLHFLNLRKISYRMVYLNTEFGANLTIWPCFNTLTKIPILLQKAITWKHNIVVFFSLYFCNLPKISYRMVYLNTEFGANLTIWRCFNTLTANCR